MAGKTKLDLVPKTPKPTVWLGSSRKDVIRAPDDVRQALGKALMVAQYGGKDHQTENFGGGMYEIKVNHDDGNTYRLVYSVEKPLLVYVLHTWTKKSHHQRKMDQKDKDLIDRRNKTLEARYVTDVEKKYGVKIDGKMNSVNKD